MLSRYSLNTGEQMNHTFLFLKDLSPHREIGVDLSVSPPDHELLGSTNHVLAQKGSVKAR